MLRTLPHPRQARSLGGLAVNAQVHPGRTDKLLMYAIRSEENPQ